MRISDWSSDVGSSDLLEVIDKFTGEVAFRTALAMPDVIDEAIAGAVRAAEPMARLASYEKRDVLTHRSEEHTSELQSLMRISYAVFCLKKKNNRKKIRKQSSIHDKNAKHTEHY